MTHSKWKHLGYNVKLDQNQSLHSILIVLYNYGIEKNVNVEMKNLNSMKHAIHH